VNDVLDYLKFNIYPGNISTKNEKSNFRKQCKPFQVENGDALSAQRGRDTTQRLIKQRYVMNKN